MHAYIYLGIADNGGPGVEEPAPFSPAGAQGIIKECSQRKMIGGMRRSEAGAFGTIAYQEAKVFGHGRIGTGPDAADIALYNVAADEIGEYGGADGKQDPPPGFLLKMHDPVYQQEKIQREPGILVADERHQRIEDTIAPLVIDNGE